MRSTTPITKSSHTKQYNNYALQSTGRDSLLFLVNVDIFFCLRVTDNHELLHTLNAMHHGHRKSKLWSL